MRNKLLTSTAVGALLATSGYAYSEGVGLRFFGGLNFLDDHNFGITAGGTSNTGTALRTSGGGVAASGTSFIGTIRSSFSQNGSFDADSGYVFGGAVNYQWDNGLILELEAAYRRNKIKLGGGGFSTFGETTTLWITHTEGSETIISTGHWTSHGSAQNTVSGSGHISAVSLMANAWYEFNLGNSQWKPYLGGGVGIAWIDLHAQGTQNITGQYTTGFSGDPSAIVPFTYTDPVSFHGTESGFAWQLGAGIGYEFAPGKQITLDYRYFNGPKLDDVTLAAGGSATEIDIGYDYDAHNIMLGIKLGI